MEFRRLSKLQMVSALTTRDTINQDDIFAVAQCEALEVIHLSSDIEFRVDNVIDVSPLARLSHLRELHLADCGIITGVHNIQAA